MGFKVVLKSNVGLERNNNEDNFFVNDIINKDSIDDFSYEGILADDFICAVADGMGGFEAGEKASLLVAKALADILREGDRADKEQRIIDAYNSAEEQIMDIKRSYGNCGTTCTALVVEKDKVKTVHIGDSRAYLVGQNGISRLTEDQTVARMKIRMGLYNEYTPEELADRNQLLDYIGKDRIGCVSPKVSDWIEWRDGDILLLCSDGLYDMCKDEEIYHILSSCDDITEGAEQLLEAVYKSGAKDNLTYIIIKKV